MKHKHKWIGMGAVILGIFLGMSSLALRGLFNQIQTELAKLAEVSRQTISLLERDEYTPSVVIALKISQIFNETVESVFRLEEDE